jgi:hypothetical protein
VWPQTKVVLGNGGAFRRRAGTRTFGGLSIWIGGRVLVTDFEARTQLRRRRAQEDDALVFAGVAAGVRSAAEGEGAYDADGRGERADATDLGGRVDGEGFLSIGMRMGSSARRGRV